MATEHHNPSYPPVPPVHPDPDLVWQVEGDQSTIENYRAETIKVAERARQEEERTP
jgi:hypothetical protein